MTLGIGGRSPGHMKTGILFNVARTVGVYALSILGGGFIVWLWGFA